MVELKNISGVIFDMDGTLVNNMMAHHNAWRDVLLEHGLDLSIEEIKEKIHGVNRDIIRRLFGDKYSELEIEQICQEKERRYRSNYKNGLELVTGAEELIQQLIELNIPFGLGTAAGQLNVDFVFDKLNLWKYFKTVVHSGHVQFGKPHPEVFLNVARQLNIDINRACVFEDSPTGAQAIIASGANGIVLTTTHVKEDFLGIENMNYFIEDFNSVRVEHNKSDTDIQNSLIIERVV